MPAKLMQKGQVIHKRMGVEQILYRPKWRHWASTLVMLSDVDWSPAGYTMAQVGIRRAGRRKPQLLPAAFVAARRGLLHLDELTVQHCVSTALSGTSDCCNSADMMAGETFPVIIILRQVSAGRGLVVAPHPGLYSLHR